MSKLKRRNINEVMDMFCLTKGDLNWSQVYYADEADKVIAELKAKNAQLEDDVAFWKAKLEDAKATECRLNRELWQEKAERAVDKQQYHTECRSDGWVHRVNEQIEEERKCRAMADTFK